MSSYRPKVYGASKMDLAAWWIEQRTCRTEFEWTARWPDLSCTLSADNCRRFWIRDVQDIRRSDALICVAPQYGGQLRGAIFEAGVAIGLGIPVYLVGNCPEFGTWQHHPMIWWYSEFHEACREILGERFQ